MKIQKNIFGKSILYEAQDIKGKIYATCAACMSIWSEFLSWANFNKHRFTCNYHEANSIIILSCQVTDLAILNDLKHLERLKSLCGNKDYYIGGCLAYRFDINITAKRLENIKSDYTPIKCRTLINYEKPFWVKNFRAEKGEGNLFRNMYPLRTSVGCRGKCKYCTIKITRGNSYELNIDKLTHEFLSHADVVLIADSLSSKQAKEWCQVAKKYNKPISIRNLEPQFAIDSFDILSEISKLGLLKILHVPIQSSVKDTLIDMGRNANKTIEFINMVEKFKPKTQLATNIIIDYKNYQNPDMFSLGKIFDYISWNPYWDGIWDRNNAKYRFNKYFN